MNPEIEKLIDLAIADGQVTENERNVIIKKAVALGENVDEVEMVLDGRLHQKEASKPKQKEKLGNIKICPSCGAGVKAFQIICDDCGHEFSDTSLNTLANLIIKLNEFKATNHVSDFNEGGQKYSQIIDNFIIPVNKNELLEFIVYAYSQASQANNLHTAITTAWLKKGSEALLKSKIAFVGTDKYELVLDFEKKYQKLFQKKSNSLVYVWIILIVFFILLGTLIILTK